MFLSGHTILDCIKTQSTAQSQTYANLGVHISAFLSKNIGKILPTIRKHPIINFSPIFSWNNFSFRNIEAMLNLKRYHILFTCIY